MMFFFNNKYEGIPTTTTDDDELAEETSTSSSSDEEEEEMVRSSSSWKQKKMKKKTKKTMQTQKRHHHQDRGVVLIALIAFGLGLVVSWAGQTVLLSVFSNSSRASTSTTTTVTVVTTPDDDDAKEYLDLIHQLRLNVASIALDIMEADTQEATKLSPLIDIGPLVDVVQSYVDIIGYKGIIDAFQEGPLIVALNDIAKIRYNNRGLDNDDNVFEVAFRIRKTGSDTVGPSYVNIPNDRADQDFIRPEYCTGCIWWLQHWLGAILADKYVTDGYTMKLDYYFDNDSSSNDNIINNNVSIFYDEIHSRQTTTIYPEQTYQNIGHGFGWQYSMMTRPNLSTFPSDLAQQFCSMYDKNEFINDLKSYIDRKCLHTIGHGIFYIMASREFNETTGQLLSVRNQFRYSGGYTMGEPYFCEAIRVCSLAEIYEEETECLSGVKHSSILLNDGDISHFKGSIHQLKSRCGIKE